MKSKLIAAGVAAVLLVAAPAWAAGLGSVTKAAGAATATSGTTSANLSAGANTSTDMSVPVLGRHPTFAQVTSDITGSAEGGATIDLATLPAKTHVHIVRLSKLKGYDASSAASWSSNSNIQTLDANVAANSSLTSKLKAAGFTPDQVVAFSSNSKSTVTLVVNDRA